MQDATGLSVGFPPAMGPGISAVEPVPRSSSNVHQRP